MIRMFFRKFEINNQAGNTGSFNNITVSFFWRVAKLLDLWGGISKNPFEHVVRFVGIHQ
jgi:hypothetical protein